MEVSELSVTDSASHSTTAPKTTYSDKAPAKRRRGPHRHAVKQPAGCHGGQRSAAHPTPAPSATPGGPGRAMGGLGAGLRAHRQPHTATSSSLPCSGTNALATNGGVGWGGVAGLVKNPPPEPQGTHRCHLGWGGGPGPAGTGLQTSSLCRSGKICPAVSGRSLNPYQGICRFSPFFAEPCRFVFKCRGNFQKHNGGPDDVEAVAS